MSRSTFFWGGGGECSYFFPFRGTAQVWAQQDFFSLIFFGFWNPVSRPWYLLLSSCIDAPVSLAARGLEEHQGGYFLKYFLGFGEFLSIPKYLCTGFSLNSYAEDTSGYIVGTYDISD
jgi:hypothetical protein